MPKVKLNRLGIRGPVFVLFVVAAMLIAPRQVSALILTFTDRAQWEAAVGAVSEETFNAFATDQIFNNGATVDVGDFTLTGIGDATSSSQELNRVDAPLFCCSRPSPNGTTDLVVRVFDFDALGPPVAFDIEFDQPILAWGADWGVTGSSFRVNHGGNVVGLAVSDGFFGFVDTMATFTTIRVDTPNNFGGANTTMDNFVYANQLSIPEPATLAMLGLGLGGLCLARHRRPNA